MASNAIAPIQSTAGAIPVRNDKGEVSMQKVKVHRYISGKRPDYAPDSSSEAESGDEDFLQRQRAKRYARAVAAAAARDDDEEMDEQQDSRLRRLKRTAEEQASSDEEESRAERFKRHYNRMIPEPQILEGPSGEEEEEEEEEEVEKKTSGTVLIPGDVESDDEENDVNEEERERRRAAIRQKLLSQKAKEQELEILEREDDLKFEESSEESSEYEEYTDSEEEELGPRLKPVFVRKKDRLTVAEREKQAEKDRVAEIEAKRALEDRKRQTLKMVEDEIRKETTQIKNAVSGEVGGINDVCTDDENDELEYEAWKLRELKRVKRDKEEKEQLDKERTEIERLRGMTEEQRRQELRNRPKLVTNKAHKGKYKFLQKYYHRGAFYLDNEEDVFKRDFSAATLEDHFDKSVLPKVMQVKNFGRSGRTKYTHLVDQDTTQFDSPWAQDNINNKTGVFKSTAGSSKS